jgi:hypothetical protein
MLDLDGMILAVNDSWLRFGHENNLRSDYQFEGVNYLDVCQHSAEGGDSHAAAALAGLLEVIATGRPKFVMTYPCPSPNERRWFKLWVETQGPDSPVLIVAHQLIRREPIVDAADIAGPWASGGGFGNA